MKSKQTLSNFKIYEFKYCICIMDDVVLTQLISLIKIDDHSIKSCSLSYTYFVFKSAASAAVISESF